MEINMFSHLVARISKYRTVRDKNTSCETGSGSADQRIYI